MKESDLNSVKFSFRVLDDGVAVDLTGSEVRLAVKKPSGMTVFQDCTITDAAQGSCEVVLTNQAYIEIGNHLGELIVAKDDIVTITNSFEFASLNAILDDETLESVNDWQTLHEIMLKSDLRPILGDGSPNSVIMPEYQGQTYLDRLGMTMYFASSVANDAWLPFGGGGGGGEGGGGPVYWNDVLLKPNTFAPAAHKHSWTDITDAPTQMQPITHVHDWNTGVTNKPTEFPPADHDHPEYITESEGDGRYTLKGETTPHSHNWTEITNKPTVFTPPLASAIQVGGAKIGNGLRMVGDYLTIREGLGIKANTATYALDIDKTALDNWYVQTDQDLAMWKGTQAAYDQITIKDPNTLYFITG